MLIEEEGRTQSMDSFGARTTGAITGHVLNWDTERTVVERCQLPAAGVASATPLRGARGRH